jgi:hypothetical protein
MGGILWQTLRGTQLFKLRERSACTVPLCCDGCKAAKFLSPATSSVVDRMYACGHLGISLAPGALKLSSTAERVCPGAERNRHEAMRGQRVLCAFFGGPFPSCVCNDFAVLSRGKLRPSVQRRPMPPCLRIIKSRRLTYRSSPKPARTATAGFSARQLPPKPSAIPAGRCTSKTLASSGAASNAVRSANSATTSPTKPRAKNSAAGIAPR